MQRSWLDWVVDGVDDGVVDGGDDIKGRYEKECYAIWLRVLWWYGYDDDDDGDDDRDEDNEEDYDKDRNTIKR